MSVVLTQKASKLLRLCELEGFSSLHSFVAACESRSEVPAICITEGCDHIGVVDAGLPQTECPRCGGDTLTSALALSQADARRP